MRLRQEVPGDLLLAEVEEHVSRCHSKHHAIYV